MPPTLKKRIKLNFERDSDPEKKFVLSVDANLTVAQLKKEISFEERIEVTQLKYFAITEENADDVVVSTLQELRDDHLISSYPLEDEVITVYSMWCFNILEMAFTYMIIMHSGDLFYICHIGRRPSYIPLRTIKDSR